jgi:GTP cyclohydrolase I
MLTYSEVEVLINGLIRKIKISGLKPQSIYGIPKGGVMPATVLSERLKLPLVDTPNINSLIVDDILDSGRTMAKYEFPMKCVLLNKNKKIKILSALQVKPTEWIQFPWEVNESGIEENIVRILEYIGEDPKREGLLETPKRVVKAYNELFAGYKQDPAIILGKVFTNSYNQMVISKDIEFTSFCEHHILPFQGTVSIAYLPKGKIVGLSKLARLVEIYARRLQVQEQMTDDIANAINKCVKPDGVAVTIKAKHSCQSIRGVRKQLPEMITTRLIGAFLEHPQTRAEYYSLIK